MNKLATKSSMAHRPERLESSGSAGPQSWMQTPGKGDGKATSQDFVPRTSQCLPLKFTLYHYPILVWPVPKDVSKLEEDPDSISSPFC